jgi:hypothetical protein
VPACRLQRTSGRLAANRYLQLWKQDKRRCQVLSRVVNVHRTQIDLVGEQHKPTSRCTRQREDQYISFQRLSKDMTVDDVRSRVVSDVMRVVDAPTSIQERDARGRPNARYSFRTSPRQRSTKWSQLHLLLQVLSQTRASIHQSRHHAVRPRRMDPDRGGSLQEFAAALNKANFYELLAVAMVLNFRNRYKNRYSGKK